jgi:hydrogenase small subunit
MSFDPLTVGDLLARRGVSRRTFLKACSVLASVLALPPGAAAELAQTLAKAQRQSVIWLSFQECTGCTESLTRSDAPALEHLLFDLISLDYHETLFAAAGAAAERAREEAMRSALGKYLVIVDGSVPGKETEFYSTSAGASSYETLMAVSKDAMAIIAVGSCAAFGGLPMASPNPTGARSVADLVKDKPVINVPGCPPIPVVLTGVLAHILTFGKLPALDHLGRPKLFFGETIHDRCYRRPFYEQGKFAKSFDDEGARNGWCLYELGCKGPVAYNACATLKWNQGVSFPIASGHGCLGCSEPGFWDKGGFYTPLSTGQLAKGSTVAAAAVAGVAAGAVTSVVSRARQRKATEGD